jgi:iron complex outermembrane receptor protein
MRSPMLVSHRCRTPVALAAVALVAASRLSAQTIRGEVRGIEVRGIEVRGTDVRSANAPIVGATVRLLELDRAQRTGAHGEFRFPDVPDGTYRVFVGVTGFASVIDTVRIVHDTVTVALRLTPTAIPLPEIVVSASPTARPSNDQYQAAESKSQIDFDNSSGSTFAEKLDDLPGVTARWNGSAPARPILRGLGDNEVLILENGLRMGDIATYDPAHATPIDALSVTEIDVVRGPATILYGPNTIGGLVNVITNIVPTAADHPLSGTAVIEGNTVSSEYAGYSNTVYTVGHSAVRLSAGGLKSADIGIPGTVYTDPATGVEFHLHSIPQTDDRTGEAGTGYSYQNTFGMVGVGYNYYNMNYGIAGVPPNPDFVIEPPTTSRISQQRHTLEFRSLFNVGGGLLQRIKLDAGYNDYTHSEFPTLQDSSGVSDPQANHFHKREFNAVLQLVQTRIGHLSGTVGLWTDVQDLTIEGQQPLGPNSRTTGFAGYAYEEYLVTPRTRLQAAARFDYNRIQTRPYPESQDTTFQTIAVSRLSNAVTGSVGVAQQFTAALTGSLSLARSFRAPTVQELFANGLDASSGTYSIGDASLGPESGYGIDASFKGTYAHAVFELSPYLNYIDHYIYGYLTGDTIQGFPVRKFVANDARLYGFEAAATIEPVEHVALRASSDYVNAENTQLGVPLPFIPPLRGLVRATYQDDRYMAMAEWRAAASQTRLGVGDTPTSGYGIYDLGVGIRLPQRGVVHTIAVHLDNVLNRSYRDNLSVIKDFVPQPGRAVRLNYELLY